MDVEKEQVNLNRVFKEVYDIVYPQIKKKRLKLLMHLGGTLRKRFVHLDGFRLKQVIINLASNALKFTESGHISLKGERRGGQIIFEVEDTGIGIAQEKQKSIFNPFEQGENSLDRRYGGTGLGLAISKRLVEIMGGEITLESKLKKGTRIRVCFPESIMGEKIPRELEKIEFAAIHETYAGKPSENTPPAAVGGEREEKEKPLLLVGEDDDAVYILLNFTFEKYGISAVRGKDGKEAWDLFEKHRSSIGAVLLDINLPEIDGIDLARRIKREEPELPVIGFSAYDYQEVKERAGDVLDGYIKKPFKIQDVYSMLKKYL
jgi:CheY-like chemotaxis protein/anti-sigma regulatory factor (Ser/Thr protein kinase)